MNPEDPYAGILLEVDKRAQKAQPPGWCLGTVLDVGEDRLVIRADGMDLDERDLMVNPMLLYDYSEEVEATYSSAGGEVTLGVNRVVACLAQCLAESITLFNLPGTLSGTITVTLKSRRLAKGDQVVLLPDREGQIYYVLCKVTPVGKEGEP